MDVIDPGIAQQIVAEYARLLERQTEWPAALDVLPYPKRTIKAAISAACGALASSGQLTNELREFLETAYVSLADYVSADQSRLMHDYQRAGADFASDSRLVKEKTATDAWRTITDSSQLAGEIARSIADEAEQLRAEFQTFTAVGATVQGATVQGDPVQGDPVQGDTVQGDTVQGDTVQGDTVQGDTAQGDASSEGASQEHGDMETRRDALIGDVNNKTC